MEVWRYFKNKWADLKLRTKLIMAFLFTVITGIVIVTLVITFSTKVFFYNYVNHHNAEMVDRWRDYFESFYIKNNYSWQGTQKVFEQPRLFQVSSGARVIVLGNSNQVLADSKGGAFLGKKPQKVYGERSANIIVDNQVVGKVTVGVNRPQGVSSLEQQFFTSVVNATMIASTIAVLLAISLALYFSRTISIPLVSLTEAAQKLAEKDFKYRLNMPWQDEIGVLAGTFNAMADNIEKNEQLRNQLIADVAHELRTPVTVLRGNLESLQAGVIEPTQEVIVFLHDEVLRLSRLIRDLQEITLVDSGKLALNMIPTNPSELVANVVSKFKGPAAYRGVNLGSDIINKDQLIELDADRITQVLSNIINNALQYTFTDNSVEISLNYSKRDWIGFVVKDGGPGILPEDIPYIFERFYRGDKARSRNEGGTGLGLAIAKSLVESHGGKIDVYCPLEGGSVFTVWIPITNDTPLHLMT